jgi:hypothetical protein
MSINKLVTAIAATVTNALSFVLFVLVALCVALYYTVFVVCHWREALTAVRSQGWRFQTMLFIIVAVAVLAQVPRIH